MTGWPKRRKVAQGIVQATSTKAVRMLANITRIAGPDAQCIAVQMVEVDADQICTYHSANFVREHKHAKQV